MSADAVYTWANWLLLASLVVGVVSTYAIVASGKIRDAESKRELAFARERTAELEKQAASALLETERLKGHLAWRRVTKKQYAQIVNSLKGKISAPVWVEFVNSDPEATLFRTDIEQTLKDAGVATQFFSGWERAVGLQLTNASSPTGQAIKHAFAEAGITFEERNEPGIATQPGEVEIIVGSKPPAFFPLEPGNP